MIQAITKTFVSLQFKAFTKGFQKVMRLENLKLFLNHELESVICGEDQSNWNYEMLE